MRILKIPHSSRGKKQKKKNAQTKLEWDIIKESISELVHRVSSVWINDAVLFIVNTKTKQK